MLRYFRVGIAENFASAINFCFYFVFSPSLVSWQDVWFLLVCRCPRECVKNFRNPLALGLRLGLHSADS